MLDHAVAVTRSQAERYKEGSLILQSDTFLIQPPRLYQKDKQASILFNSQVYFGFLYNSVVAAQQTESKLGSSQMYPEGPIL